MKGYKTNIESEALENTNFRKVLYTADHFQLVLMSLQPQEEIGNEIHITNDQFFRIESGQGKCIVDGHIYEFNADLYLSMARFLANECSTIGVG